MNRILLVVEGQTETAVFRDVLAEYLAVHNVSIHPRTAGKPGHKGGNSFEKSLKDIVNLIKQEPHSVVTTFFDYYSLPTDWPGRIESLGFQDIIKKRQIIENALLQAVHAQLGEKFNPRQFIPYIQMHELESLLFSVPAVMAEVFDDSSLTEKFMEIVSKSGGCEAINDNQATAPSKRITQLFSRYRKGSSVNAHAPIIFRKTGIDAIRKECPNFNEWIEKLIEIGNS